MENRKYLFGIFLILASVVYLIYSSVKAGQEYFLTVDELLARQEEMIGRKIRVSGAVIGDTIFYDPEKLEVRFTIAHVPGDLDEVEAQGGMAKVLAEAVRDPNRSRIEVVYYGVKPDLLRNEAQAIVTGTLGEDGVFYADELLLKCPTKYEAAAPEAGSGR
ncbi:MAG: cytochrome c maturation protein CcmE [Chloroflexi bacterium]|nr:cytochrome c maturation protein CcmE [Chloroflexota bacterium]